MTSANNQSLVRMLMEMSPHAHALLDRSNDSLLAWNESFATLCKTPPRQGAPLLSLGFPADLGALVSGQAAAVMAGKNLHSLPQPHFKLKNSDSEGLYAARLVYVSPDGRRVLLSLQQKGAWDFLEPLLQEGTLYDFLPDMVTVYDLEGRVLACNQAGCTFLHKARDEVIGRTFDDILEKGAAAARKLFYRCVSTDNPQAANLTFTHNGQTKTLIATMDPIRDQAGNLIGALSVAYDDTQRQLMDKTLLSHNSLLHAASEATQHLLTNTGNFDKSMKLVLATLGQAVDADRVYVWQVRPGPDPKNPEPYLYSLYRWFLDAVLPPEMPPYTGCPLSEITPATLENFRAGKCLNKRVKDLPFSIQQKLAPQGIMSLLVAPVLLQGELWGFISFDNCHSEDVFSESEENILRAAGAVIGAAVHDRHINAALRESEDRFRMVAEATGEIIWSMGTDGRIDYVSDRVTPVLGYEPDELIGQDISVLHTPPALPMPEATPQRPVIVREKESFCKDGSTKWLRTSFKFLFDDNGSMRKVFATSLDITEMRAAVEEIHLGKEALESANLQLAAAAEEARKASLAKDEFVANMSHEIRTPLNAIIGITELMLREDLPSRQREFMEKIKFAGRSLLRIVNDVLDFGAVEAGKLEIDPAPFNLNEVISGTMGLFAHQAEEKGLTLTSEIAPDLEDYYLGDAARLEQVLINLTSNAIKFTFAGGVAITVERENPTEELNSLHFSVNDTGIGFEPKEQKSLFAAFNQADASATRPYGGLGLGLALCKKIVELMGGRIWCESEPGKGSTFHFTTRLLPAGQENPHGKTPQSYAGLRILLASPDAEELLELRGLLRSLGCARIDEADTADEALRKMCPNYPAGPVKCDYDLLIIGAALSDVQKIEHMRLKCGRDSGRLGRDVCDLEVLCIVEECERAAWTNAAHKPFRQFLVRPFTRAELTQAVSNIYGHELTPGGRAGELCAEQALMADFAGSRILVVEDNEINQLVAEEMLTRAGLKVTLAGNGAQALQLLAEQTFDLVLMDIQMPIMDGLTATAELRKEPSLAGLPVIAMTAHAMSGDAQKSLDAGMNAHLTKPIDCAELFRTLAFWLNKNAKGEAA